MNCNDCYYAHVNCLDKSLACDMEDGSCGGDEFLDISKIIARDVRDPAKIKERVIDRVLEILDKYYLWHYDSVNDSYTTVGDGIVAEIQALKGGE